MNHTNVAGIAHNLKVTERSSSVSCEEGGVCHRPPEMTPPWDPFSQRGSNAPRVSNSRSHCTRDVLASIQLASLPQPHSQATNTAP